MYTSCNDAILHCLKLTEGNATMNHVAFYFLLQRQIPKVGGVLIHIFAVKSSDISITCHGKMAPSRRLGDWEAHNPLTNNSSSASLGVRCETIGNIGEV